MQFLMSYLIHKASFSKVQKGQTKVNVQLILDFDVDNICINGNVTS